MNRQRIWLGAIALLFVPAIHYWAAPTAPRLKQPDTPIDLMLPDAAAQWQFLDAAQELVPPRASYTITAATRDEEMSLFMMSLGLLTDATGEPSSYYSVPLPQIGGRAEYILAFGCTGADPAAHLVSYAPGGCVFRRQRK